MKFINWLLFVLLCIIWGSSFILMKEGLIALNAFQVASIRIFSAGIVLFPFSLKAIRQIPAKKLPVVIVSGLLGSFFPAFLFCIAETKIDSSLAGILNALTPLFTIVVGMFFFELKANNQKITGIMIGFIGLLFLFVSNGHLDTKNLSYTFLVLVATLMYGINVNLIGSHMKDIGSFNIATVAFSFLTIPCLFILYFTGYFNMSFSGNIFWWSTAASSVLGIMGTAVASILFYMLLKRAGALFASMVTYGIPLVAVVWGVFYHEKISTPQIACMAVILVGVYLVNAPVNPITYFAKRKENKLP